MSIEVIAIALGAGLLGGTVGGAAIGAVQAWMARGRGTRVQYFGRLPGPPGRPEAVRVSSGRLTGMEGFDRFVVFLSVSRVEQVHGVSEL